MTEMPQVEQSSCNAKGETQCSDEMLNQIHRASVRSTFTNCFGISTDYPRREQLSWTGDAAYCIAFAIIHPRIQHSVTTQAPRAAAKAVRGACKTDYLNEGKSLSKNGSPVAFLIKKADYDYSLFFFINCIKGKVLIDYYKTNVPACQYRIVYRTELLRQIG